MADDPWSAFDASPASGQRAVAGSQRAKAAPASAKPDPWAIFDAKPEEQPPPEPAPRPSGFFAVPDGGELGDLSTQAWAQPTGRQPEAVAPIVTAGKRIGSTIADAYTSAPNPLMTPRLQTALEGSPYAPVIPLLQGGGMLLRGAGAVMAGVPATINELAGAAGQEQFGRDFNLWLQSAPMDIPNMRPPGRPAVTEPAIRTDIDRPYLTPDAQARIEQSVREPSMPAQANESSPTTVPRFAPQAPSPIPTMIVRPNPLAGPAAPDMAAATPDDHAAAGWRPLAPGEPVQPGMEVATDQQGQRYVREPAPQAAGAQATPSAQSGLTPEQEAAYRSTAEGSKLIEPQEPGVRDENVYVNGVQPNTAEVEQTVHAARDLKMLNQKVPDVAQEAVQIANDNSEARTRHYDQTSGSPVDLQNAEAARDAQTEIDLGRAWASKRSTNAAGDVVEAANRILSGPDGKIDVVAKNVRAIRDKLFDRDGELETDPEVLYGVRREINARLSKEALRQEPTNQLAASQLIQLRNLIDVAILDGAPHFATFLENFQRASRLIDEMDVLQSRRSDLFDAAGRMQYSRVQRLMKDIVDSRMSGGVNRYQSIRPEMMQRLWALRDDLRRSASAQDLARAAGSDTFQNAWHAMRDAAVSRGPMLVGAGIGTMLGGGPISAGLGAAAGQGLSTVLSNRAARADRARGMQMLRPQLPPRNPLNAP